MIGSNLRHLRVFLAVADSGSVTRAAETCCISQPAVTQAVAKLESLAGTALFTRAAQGLFVTEAGAVLAARTARAMHRLDATLGEIAPRLMRTATRAQLNALIAASEVQNFSLAARRLGVAQPTLHRAVTQLEREAGRNLFQRSAFGIVPTRGCATLAREARLAFVELDQARAELADLAGQEGSEIVIGAMPLSRAHVLPRALAALRARRPALPVRVLEGTYDELLGGLRRGEIDFLIGALRSPAPIGDIVQERLFDDSLVILAGPGHPLLSAPVTLAALQAAPWLVPRAGTPARAQFDAMIAAAGLPPPEGIIETGSAILMREMVQDNRHLACLSRAQAQREIVRGIVRVLPFTLPGPERPIGLTLRQGWQPTPAQAIALEEIRAATAP